LSGLLEHRSAERDPGGRGRAFGLAHAGAVANTVAVYRRMLGLTDEELRVAGRAVGDRVVTDWPDLVEEIEGLAEGAGVAVEALLAVNARTELMATAGGECSLVGAVQDGACVVVQNWDWHPDLAASLVVWTVRQPGGRSFTTLTEAGMLAKLGVSSAGLCCGLNFLRCSADGGVGGVPIHVLLRVLLDRTETLPDAVALLRAATVSASSCITVGWARGDEAAVVAAELSPGGCELVWPDTDDRLVHTNHFLVPPPRGRDLEAAEAPSTLLRRWVVARAVRAGDLEAALCSHAGAPESPCRHEDPALPWAERRATLASVAMEPGRGRMRVAAGPPCSTPLREVPTR
jgi:isopenicillin-N N-acyltransferase like protein